MKSVLLCVCVLTLASVFNPVFGAGGVLPGDGSSTTPYLIEDLVDFQTFSDPANSATYWASGVYTKLMTNLNLSSANYTDSVIAADTDPSSINYQGTPYRGSFDGNGYELNNLTIDDNNAGLSNIGLFGGIEGGSVENLGIVNCTIIAGVQGATVNRSVGYVGTLCGKFNGGTVSNCYSTGSVEVDVQSTGEANAITIGGLCGYFDGTMTNSGSECSVTVHVSSSLYSQLLDVGGLCGVIDGQIDNCYSTGSVSATASKYTYNPYIGFKITSIGGFCGKNNATINKSYSTGSVYCSSNSFSDSTLQDIGGFIGYNLYGSAHNSYATGSVYASSSGDSRIAHCYRVGGFLGNNQEIIANCYSTGLISASVSGVYENLSYIGGLCGGDYNVGGITGCFWDTDTSETTVSAAGIGKTTAEMMNESTFTVAGWDMTPDDGTSVWYMPAAGYPQLAWQLVNPVDLGEFCILAQYWGDTGCTSGQDCFAADWYVDGTIDTLDLYQLTSSWLEEEMALSGI
ncbi:MAG: GLUG motif-containing protein [Sedimentisphaeraceae bacterium JB056]